MSKLLFFVFMITSIISCGNEKNVDEEFLSTVRDEQVERYEPVKPDLESLSISLKEVTSENIIFFFSVFKRSSNTQMLVNADRLTKVVSSYKGEVGRMICLNIDCSSFNIELLNRYSIEFNLAYVNISAKLLDNNGFEFLNEAILTKYSLSFKDQFISGKDIFSKSGPDDSTITLQTLYYSVFSSDYNASNRIEAWLPVKINFQNVFYLPKIEFNEVSETLKGYYLDLSTNNVNTYYLRIEDAK